MNTGKEPSQKGPRILLLHLKRKWWEQKRDGIMLVELRLANAYWAKRLEGREYDEVHLVVGYPKDGDTSTLLRFAWRGADRTTITHEEFGPAPVEVFAIHLTERLQ